MSFKTKLTFYKSYAELGWWAVRVPETADWSGHQVDLIGFGVTQTQAEHDLVRREQERVAESAPQLAA